METNNIREIDIRNYWPPVVRDTDEFQQIATAENPEFNKLAGCIYRALQDSFVQDATEYGVGRWEKILNISPENGDTLDDRKARILAYLNIKLPYSWRVLEKMLIGMLGEGNVSMKMNNDTSTLTIGVGLSATQAQIAQIEQLLDRVLPRNLVTEMEWVDGLPMDYTHVEYLENTERNYIDTGLFFATGKLNFRISSRTAGVSNYITGILPHEYFGVDNIDKGKKFLLYYETADCFSVEVTGMSNKYFFGNNNLVGVAAHIDIENGLADVNGIKRNFTPLVFESVATNILMFARATWYGPTDMRISRANAGVRIHAFEVTAKANGNIQYGKFIPALDPTGAPCMFDTVTKTAFYNSGTGDFLYPGAEQAVPTLDLDLDAKSYAKLTPNGVRRLYQVPKGYACSMDEYAAANGFKELVEPPAPLEGYWIPEWRETETQLICDWIETEPPTEVTENE